MAEQLSLLNESESQGKKCTKCGEWKIFDAFHRCNRNKDGYAAKCKECRSKQSSEYRKRPEIKARLKTYWETYSQQPEKKSLKKAQGKIYRQRPEVTARRKKYHKSPERRAKQKEYREKPEIMAQIKKYQIVNKEWLNKQRLLYYYAHSDECNKRRQKRSRNPETREQDLKKHVEWIKKQKENPDWIAKTRLAQKNYFQKPGVKEKINKRATEKRKTCIKTRLAHNIRGAIGKSVKHTKNGRHWETIVGYTLKELKIHLENQFTEGMTWQNYGMWHIDHATPIAVFNFEKPEDIDFRKCWALSNLQPLWAKDNLRKNAKIEKHFQPSLIFG